MKNLNRLLSISLMLYAILLLFSCKKQIAEPKSEQFSSSLQSTVGNGCKPAVLGVYSEYNNNPGNGQWLTLAQKWYADGKVKYLKAMHGGWTGAFLDPVLDYMFILDWAEVSYEGNQVYLKDVVKNRVMLRVTLDNQGRPVASYYDYVPSPNSFMHDTTYYYYNGDRLESLISLYALTYTTPYPSYGWRKYVFSYDTWGNVTKAEFPEGSGMRLQYDYSKPVEGMISNFHITSSLKLLEYLELLKLPMHHALTKSEWRLTYNQGSPNEYYYIMRTSVYKNYVITNGLVRSYEFDDQFRNVTFYNGWDCGPGSSMSTNSRGGKAISDLNRFQELFPMRK